MNSRRKRRRAAHRKTLSRRKKVLPVVQDSHDVVPPTRFFPDFEKYFYLRIQSLPVKWEWIGVAIVLLILVTSFTAGYFHSSILSGSADQVIKSAAIQGDYPLAQTLLAREYNDLRVLGIETELEEIVYPEKKVQNALARQLNLLEKYPGSRDLFLGLATLYQSLGESETARHYWEMARALDPNNPLFVD